MLTRHQVELIEIPQRMGATRKNAADIKMAVDADRAVRSSATTSRRSCSAPATATSRRSCTSSASSTAGDRHRDRGVDVRAAARRRATSSCSTSGSRASTRRVARRAAADRTRREPASKTDEAGPDDAAAEAPATPEAEEIDLGRLVTQTLSGLERSSSGPVLASMLKRTILRKDPTFNEANYGFRGFGELLRNLADRGVVAARRRERRRATPRCSFPTGHRRRGRGVRAAALDRRAAQRRRNGPLLPLGTEDPAPQAPSPTSARSASATAASSSSARRPGRAASIDMEWDDDRRRLRDPPGRAG